MKIFNNNLNSDNSLKVGDTLLSARDLSSESFFDRSIEHTLSKDAFPQLYDLYKEERTNYCTDIQKSIATSTSETLSYFSAGEYDYSYNSSTYSLKIKNRVSGDLNVVDLTSTSCYDREIIVGDNKLFAKFAGAKTSVNNKITISTNADLAAGNLGDYQYHEIIPDSFFFNVQIMNDHFYVFVAYSNLTSINIFKCSSFDDVMTITGIKASDDLNDLLVFNSVDFNTNSSPKLAYSYVSFILLENENVIYKPANTNNIYSFNLNNYLSPTLIDTTAYTNNAGYFSYKNDFILFTRDGVNSVSIYAKINNNVYEKILYNNLPSGTGVNTFNISYIDFENNIFLVNKYNSSSVFESTDLWKIDFDSNDVILLSSNPFYSNDSVRVTTKISTGYSYSSLNNSSNFAFLKMNQQKNYLFFNNDSSLILENGATQFSVVDVILNSDGFLNKFTLSIIPQATDKDKFWTKGE